MTVVKIYMVNLRGRKVCHSLEPRSRLLKNIKSWVGGGISLTYIIEAVRFGMVYETRIPGENHDHQQVKLTDKLFQIAQVGFEFEHSVCRPFGRHGTLKNFTAL